MAEVIYLLCGLTSLGCAVLLLRGYWTSRSRLLFWSSLCFGCLAWNNVMLFVDVAVAPAVDYSAGWRSAVALAGLGVLVFGLVWDVE